MFDGKPDSFSPVTALGLMIRPFPLVGLNQILGLITGRLARKHPAVLKRLEPIVGSRILLMPTDLRIHFLLCIEKSGLKATAMRHIPAANICIKAPLPLLVGMLNNEIDGDALFFSRHLIIEGDTEALLTFRNALDSEDIDLGAEILAAFGPFHQLAARAFADACKACRITSQALMSVQAALLAETDVKLAQLSAQTQQQQTRIDGCVARLDKQAHQLSQLTKAGHP